MSDITFDADAVSQLVTYVAPGYLAFMGYRLRLPAPERPSGEVLIIAVAASLPLVALAQSVLPGTQRPSQFGYVSLLLASALLIGFGLALVRSQRRVISALATVGYRIQPSGTIYSQTLAEMSPEGLVTIELKDGRLVSGCPRSGPQTEGDGVRELYLLYPEAWNSDADEWQEIPGGAGLIVPLTEIASIVLSEDPTTPATSRSTTSAETT